MSLHPTDAHTTLLLADDIGHWLMAIAISLPRIAASFLVIPLLTQDTAPPLVRNSLFVSMAILLAPVIASAETIGSIIPEQWPLIILKEIFIGTCLGFLFSSVFWAIGMAGGIIDTQAGSNMANAMDPLQGHQTTLNGLWLSRFASVLFVASGGFLLFLDLLFGSYQIWPINSAFPELHPKQSLLFISEFKYTMTAALAICAPAMMLLALLDFIAGLINRFAEQLNVLQLTTPIKNWVAGFILLLSMGTIIEIVLNRLAHNQMLLDSLQQVWG